MPPSQPIRRCHDQDDRRKIAEGIVRNLRFDDGLNDKVGVDDDERIAVWRCGGRPAGAHRAGSPGNVLHVELLAKLIAEVLRQHSGGGVGGAARRCRDHDAHRARRIVRLCRGRIRQQQEVSVVTPALAQRIDHSVSWVLNPLSHSQTVDRYRKEIEDAIYAVDELGHVAARVTESVKTSRLQLIQFLAEALKLRSLQITP